LQRVRRLICRPTTSRVEAARRILRLRSDTPSFDSSIDNRRLTVEIGNPNERAARLTLSNGATFTNIRISPRSAMQGHFAIFGN
jgi:hypothetical protein